MSQTLWEIVDIGSKNNNLYLFPCPVFTNELPKVLYYKNKLSSTWPENKEF